MVKKPNLSLIIPTYNRPRTLYRLLTYYKEQNVNYEIIVPDSSYEKNKERNGKIISSFSTLNITHLDHFSYQTNFYQKIAQIADFIKTKYCVLCADDDYITPQSLDRSCEFIQENSDFTAVGGYYITFLSKIIRQNMREFYWKRYLTHFAHVKPYMSLTSSNPKIRLINHFSFYFPTIYYVHRTSFLKMIYNETIPYVKDLSFAESFGELLLDMLTVIYGKIKTLNIFYGAREFVLTPEASSSRYGGVIKPIKEGTFNSLYGIFRNCLTKHLTQHEGIDFHNSKKAVDEGMSRYIQKYLLNFLYSSEIKQLIKSLLRPIYYLQINLAQHRKVSYRKPIDLRYWNRGIPSFKYHEDFIRIQNSVLNDADQES